MKLIKPKFKSRNQELSTNYPWTTTTTMTTNLTCNNNQHHHHSSSTTQCAKGKTWRSLDLTQHPPPSSLSPSNTGLLTINCNPTTPHSPSSHQLMLTPNTISNLAQIGHNQPSYYYEQGSGGSNSRSDFKNRRSSSEPVQDLLANASHGSCLINALAQHQHPHHQHQTQLQQRESHRQIVIHSPNPIECLDAALKVRTHDVKDAGTM